MRRRHVRAKSARAALKKTAGKRATDRYVLKLFITGSTARSLRAIADIKALCEEHLAGRYFLEVVDVHQEPNEAVEEQIIALPTLVRKHPAPLRKILGSFSDGERLLAILGLSRIRKAT